MDENQISNSNNLFWGRENDIQRVVKYLKNEDCRLLTLIGPGGIGKTHLATQIIDQTEGLFEDSYFVYLQSITSEQGFITALINTLKIQIFDSISPLDQVINWLSDREILIVLDNFEQLIHIREIINIVISKTQKVKILVTSRDVINLQSEYLHHLKGLDSQTGRESPAVQMFISYAKRINATFMAGMELPHIIHICQLVDGMPLAIQLASSWVKTISCETIANEIENNYQTLQTEYIDLPIRHRKIDACFDYSWDMLSKNEQGAFCRLAIFKDGWTLEAAQHVSGVNIRTLKSLINKSFIRYDSTKSRYYIHELLRQYGQMKLSQEGREFELTQQKYINYLTEQAFTLTTSFKRGISNGHKYIASEKNNLINVWELSIRIHNIGSVSKLWEVLFLFFYQTHNYLEGEELFGYLVENSEIIDKDIQIVGFTIFGWFKLRRGKINEAVSIMQRSQANYNYESKAEIIYLIHYAYALVAQGNYDEAEIMIPLSLKAAEKLQDPYYLSFTLYNYGYFANIQGNDHEAQQYLQQSLKISRQIGLDWGTGLTLLVLGTVQESVEQYDNALKSLEESYSILERANDYWGMVFSLSYSCRILLQKNDLNRAHDYLQRAFDKALESENISALLGVILDSAYYLEQINKLKRAVILAIYVRHHNASYSIEVERSKKLLKQLESVMSSERYTNGFEKGIHLSNSQAIEIVNQILRIAPNANNLHPHDILTPREQEILQLLATSVTTAQIATQLTITKATLRTHIKRIYHKLNVHSRLEAVEIAQSEDLL